MLLIMTLIPLDHYEGKQQQIGLLLIDSVRWTIDWSTMATQITSQKKKVSPC